MLNRRFAPDVYLGLLDLVDADGEVHDHVLVMRRMPAERRLSRLLGGPDAGEHLRDVAKAVAAIHAAAPRPAAAAEAAALDAVERNWRGQRGGDAALRGRRCSTRSPSSGSARASAATWPGAAGLFEARIRAGHAVDGHGDLLAEDIFCLDDGPRILDCLAFDDRLRYGDVLADIAFLAMDVERLAGPARRRRDLLRWYGEFSAEHHPATLAHHYIAYRAQVRAKVACLRAVQGDERVPAPWPATTWQLCADHLDRGRVRLVLVGGPPGTGKSTLAAAMAEATGWTVLRSDEVRKELAGLGPSTTPPPRSAPASTGPQPVAATYEELRRRATAAAGAGRERRSSTPRGPTRASAPTPARLAGHGRRRPRRTAGRRPRAGGGGTHRGPPGGRWRPLRRHRRGRRRAGRDGSARGPRRRPIDTTGPPEDCLRRALGGQR